MECLIHLIKRRTKKIGQGKTGYMKTSSSWTNESFDSRKQKACRVGEGEGMVTLKREKGCGFPASEVLRERKPNITYSAG
ncbi:hypothetical protein CEXT_509711 [Caerostris extrusa]|uniref:Uncharacterized protein n=1 Tax=Caerostris extrusa TaxID=172846 RepID=A0AAV4U5S9_CAEEX|nr:hypothetical protein CEXT_509711 [Caerostris extrusa]